VNCHVCGIVPIAFDATIICPVGTTWLTSPTSVEPGKILLIYLNGPTKVDKGLFTKRSLISSPWNRRS
jgi:hypothetical protein